jgi:kynurenine formamidase
VQTGKIERVTNTGTYLDPPFHFDAQAALLLVERGAKLVGIDSHNIDDTRGTLRPVHKILLGNNVLICEHITLSNYPNLRSASSLCRLKLAG